MATIRYTLSLPEPLNIRVKDLAASLGLPVATFIRHLLFEEVRKVSVPSFPMSKKTEEIIENTDKDYAGGRLQQFSSVKEMFKNLNE